MQGSPVTRPPYLWTIAWFVLCATLALHILEEARAYHQSMDFLRQVFPWIPVFEFRLWLTNVAGALLVLFALTWAVYRRSGLMWPASYALATFAAANAVFHLMASIDQGRAVGGSFTAPALLLAALFLFLSIPPKFAAR